MSGPQLIQNGGCIVMIDATPGNNVSIRQDADRIILTPEGARRLAAALAETSTERGTCAECRYWERNANSNHDSQCRRNPPTVNGTFPSIGRHDWCGEFSARSEAL